MENANHHTLLLHRIGKATCGTPGNKSSGSSVSTVTVNRGWVPRYMNAEYTDGSGPQSVIKLADYVSRERGQGGRSIILNANLRDLKRADTHSTPQYVFMTCWSASTLHTHAHTRVRLLAPTTPIRRWFMLPKDITATWCATEKRLNAATVSVTAHKLQMKGKTLLHFFCGLNIRNC